MAAIESFALCAEFAEIPSDTLIIDGDTIYIEQDQVILPEDSLSPVVPKLNRVSNHLFSATVLIGLNATNSLIELASSEYTLLDDFIGAKKNPALNPVVSADLGVRFLTIRGPSGNLELSLASGVCLNKLKAGYTSMKDPVQLTPDSVLSFEASDGELMVQYFTITEPPNIGEVDTLYPQLVKSMLHYSSAEVSGKFRATLNRGPKAVRYFFETGIIKRFVTVRSSANDIILLNNRGNSMLIQPTSLRGINMLVPHFAVGAEIKLSGSSRIDETFFTLGAQFNASLPFSTLSRNEVLSIATGNVGLSFCGRFHF